MSKLSDIQNTFNIGDSGLSHLEIKLGIDAQNIVHHVMVNNRRIEKEIEGGIKKAIDTMFSDGNFEDRVAEIAKAEIENVIRSEFGHYEIKRKIREAIEDSIGDNIKAHISKWSEELFSKMENKNEENT